jgi:pre-mRNA-processing factor 17
VQSVSFFPGTGHLLLSASLDGKCKVWDVALDSSSGAGPVRRTYAGHGAGVRDARFRPTDGLRFASASFDRRVLVWDTETGACVANVGDGSVPYSAVWHPTDPHVILTACGSRKIVQYDTRAGGKEVMNYDQHLGPVNTVTFFDEGRKFVSTSDDKKLLVWELNTPAPIKYIADPTLHAIPAVALHPSGAFFVGQSMDNTLVVYACGDKVGRVVKKTFKGHVTAGFACQPAISPDGHFLASGDGEGTTWMWDWKTGRLLSKLVKAHEDGPAIGAAWHPLKPSWVATCGWDGLIKLWD